MSDHAESQVSMLVISGPHEGRRFEFDRHDTFVAGRSSEAHLSLPEDPRFSRFHFRLEVRPPECYLVDLDSRNGTRVNGERVSECFLKTGDVIQVGRTKFRVEISQVASQTVVPEAGHAESDGMDERLLAETRLTPESGLSWDHLEEFQPVPGYQLLEELGRGAMGAVYRGVRKSTSEQVAIKLIVPQRAGNQRDTQLFLREASVLSSLDHPRIVKFHELGMAAGQFYLVMENVPTVDFAKVLCSQSAESKLRISCGIICQVLEALEYAHSLSYVHRDIKPANILVTKPDRKLKCKLADFGLAKNFTNAGFSEITRDGEARGTLAFMPPEQLIDCRFSKPAADIYSVGATLYYFLAGKYPFDFTEDRSAIAQILQDEIVPIQHHCPNIPAEVATIIHRSLSREPGDRFSSAGEMREMLLPFSKRRESTFS
ncbi:MAG: serine/threonine protein kinase [Planctomyces sp.]|nr:serine/threonine protein kinase [Planctomyces sp.]